MINFRRFRCDNRLPQEQEGWESRYDERDEIDKDSFFKTLESWRVFFDQGCCYQLSVLLKSRLDFHASHREVAGPNGVGDDGMRLVS